MACGRSRDQSNGRPTRESRGGGSQVEAPRRAYLSVLGLVAVLPGYQLAHLTLTLAAYLRTPWPRLLTADDGDAQFGMEGRFWYDQPSLQSPGSDEQLQAVTATQPERGNDDEQDICVCTSVRSAGEEPRPQSVVYGPLPEDATEVDVLLPGLDPVTVPVTR